MRCQSYVEDPSITNGYVSASDGSSDSDNSDLDASDSDASDSDTDDSGTDDSTAGSSDAGEDESDSDEHEDLTKKPTVPHMITSLSVEFSPIFRQLGFEGEALPGIEVDEYAYFNDEAFLRDSRDPEGVLEHSPLSDHRIAARSFAMFPMYSRLETFVGLALDTGDRAITVWDVQKDLIDHWYVQQVPRSRPRHTDAIPS